MRDLDAVLVVNAEFYRAFNERDLEAMDDVWARRSPVAVLHPGWPVITGREDVMASWAQIFGNAAGGGIECVSPEAFFCGDAIFVLCYERLEEATLAATNIFVRENGIWKLVHHQAGPSQDDAPAAREAPAGTIH